MEVLGWFFEVLGHLGTQDGNMEPSSSILGGFAAPKGHLKIEVFRLKIDFLSIFFELVFLIGFLIDFGRLRGSILRGFGNDF